MKWQDEWQFFCVVTAVGGQIGIVQSSVSQLMLHFLLMGHVGWLDGIWGLGNKTYE
jgi:hypothetical protein